MSKRIALVTGAYRGIGLETVKQLAAKQYTVILTGRKRDRGAAAAERLAKAGGDVHYHDLDVTSADSIEALRTELASSYGKLDALVNNAGIHYDTQNDVAKPDWKIVEEAFATNFFGPWRLTVALTPLLAESGAGRVVMVSSGAGSMADATPGTPAYSTSKAALNMLTKQFAAKFESDGIKVNAVCPGWVRTDMGGASAPRDVSEGAAGIVWAATLGDDGPTGGFYRDGKPIAW